VNHQRVPGQIRTGAFSRTGGPVLGGGSQLHEPQIGFNGGVVVRGQTRQNCRSALVSPALVDGCESAPGGPLSEPVSPGKSPAAFASGCLGLLKSFAGGNSSARSVRGVVIVGMARSSH